MRIQDLLSDEIPEPAPSRSPRSSTCQTREEPYVDSMADKRSDEQTSGGFDIASSVSSVGIAPSSLQETLQTFTPAAVQAQTLSDSHSAFEMSCTIWTGDMVPSWVGEHNASRTEGPFVCLLWTWADVPLDLCNEGRKGVFSKSRFGHNSLQAKLCLPESILSNSPQDDEAFRDMTLGHGRLGLRSQGLHKTLRNRCFDDFDQAKFEAVEATVAEHMIRVALESYKALEHVDKASEGEAFDVQTGSI